MFKHVAVVWWGGNNSLWGILRGGLSASTAIALPVTPGCAAIARTAATSSDAVTVTSEDCVCDHLYDRQTLKPSSELKRPLSEVRHPQPSGLSNPSLMFRRFLLGFTLASFSAMWPLGKQARL